MLNKNNLKVVGQFASTEKSRYTLTSIQVTKAETIATNGHYMVRVSNPTIAEPNPADVADHASFLLEGKQAIEIGNALGKDGLASVAPNNSEGAFSIIAPNGTVFHAPQQSGQFPNVDVIMPTEQPTLVIGLNAEYVAKLAKAFAEFQSDKRKGRCKTIKLSLYSDTKPVKMEAENESGQTMTALLMPVRI